MAAAHQTFIHRFAARKVERALDDARVACLIGPRQAGKSTLATRIATDRQFPTIVSLDQTQVRAAAERDPAGFVASLPTPAMIDEIQRVPELLLEIKHRVDQVPGRGQYLLTGSADIRSLVTVRDALPGRADYVTLLPLAQAELLGLDEPTLLDDLFGGAVPYVQDASVGVPSIAGRIRTGGFPEAMSRQGPSLDAYFDGYATGLLDRDLRDIAKIRDTAAFGRLLSIVAARTSGLVNRARMARDVGLDDKTVAQHLDTLARMFLVHVVPSWHVNVGARFVKSPKLHVADTGLLSYLLGLDVAGIASSEQVGAVLETFVACEFARHRTWADRRIDQFHFRDKDGHEVDTVLERADGAIVGVEVKATASVRNRDLASLEFLRERTGDRFRCGVVLYLGQQTYPMGDRLWAVPVSALWHHHA